MDQPTTTPNVNLPAPLVPMREKLPVLLQSYLPKMEKFKLRADAELDALVEPTTQQQAEDFIESLAAVRDVYTANQKMRKEMTDITDAFKDLVMDYERDFNPGTDAKSKYNEKKKLLVAWQEKERIRIETEQKELQKKKDRDNHIVDLRAKMLENLNQTVTTKLIDADNATKDYFAKCTVENFDAQAEAFKKMSIKLKPEFYRNAFIGVSNPNLISTEEHEHLVAEVQQTETYDKWNAIFVEKLAPIVNTWKAKIPDLKNTLLQMEELKKQNPDAATKLQEEQQQKVVNDTAVRQQQITFAGQQAIQGVQQQANIEKIGNDLQAQASGQTLGDKGKTKLVLKFKDAKSAPKALMEIQIFCMRDPKFTELYPGFQRRDHKSKKLMFDEKGRPIYIEPVQFWIDYFLDNIDGSVEGILIEEDSKVTIRK